MALFIFVRWQRVCAGVARRGARARGDRARVKSLWCQNSLLAARDENAYTCLYRPFVRARRVIGVFFVTRSFARFARNLAIARAFRN